VKLFRGNIARKIIITYSSLALIVVLVSAGSVAGIAYARQLLIVDALQREQAALLSARIRAEALFLTNTIQRYAIAPGSGQSERQMINDQIALLEDLLRQAINSVDPNDVDESIAIGLIRQYLVSFNVQSRHVLDTSDEEGGFGADTERQMNILFGHYQPALIESLMVFEKLERETAEASFAQAEQYAARIATFLSLLSVAAIILAAAMSLWLMKRFVIPFTALTENVRLSPDEAMNTPIYINTNDEMGALARALNHMKAQINDSRNKLERYAATLEAQVEERTRELKLLAITDPLTGSYNRGHFFRLSEQSFSEARRLNHPFSVAIFDVDHFKNINDKYGHAAGDQALKKTVQIMQSQIRQMDILGRYGGEEFIVALPNANINEALQIAQRVAAAVKAHQFEENGERFGITISGGIAQHDPPTGDSLENLLLKADRVLYQAKEKGRDLVIVYQTTIINKDT